MLRYLLICFLSLSFSLNAQETLLQCGTDEMRQALFEQHPELHSGILNATAHFDSFTRNYNAQASHYYKYQTENFLPNST